MRLSKRVTLAKIKTLSERWLRVFSRHSKRRSFGAEARRDLLFKLTIKAQQRLQELGVAKREIIRRMKVTPTQFYRLLDQRNVRKSIDQMLRLLVALDCSVELNVSPKAA